MDKAQAIRIATEITVAKAQSSSDRMNNISGEYTAEFFIKIYEALCDLDTPPTVT